MPAENEVLLNIQDATEYFAVTRINPDSYEVKIGISYLNATNNTQTPFRMVLSGTDLKSMIENLVNGKEGTYGNNSFWQTNKIIIKKPDSHGGFRNICLCQRFLIGGFTVPAVISEKVIIALKNLNIG